MTIDNYEDEEGVSKQFDTSPFFHQFISNAFIMEYIDIHTHRIPKSKSAGPITCLNWIIGKEKPDFGFLSAGIHPWFIEKEGEEQWALLEKEACAPEIRMIGEAGLDKLMITPWETQIRLLRAQIRLSESLHKPLILHCVKAWSELMSLHKEFKPVQPWIIHGFRGKKELADQLIQQGFYLSFGERFRKDSLYVAWPDRLFLETDESLLLISEIYQSIASALQIPIEQLALQVEKNFQSLFLF